jgi:hypothetical protein
MTGERRHSSIWLLPVALLLLVGAGYGARVLLIQLAEKSIAEHQSEIQRETACVVYQAPGPMTPHPWGEDNLWDLLHPSFDAIGKLKPIYDELQGSYGSFPDLKEIEGIAGSLQEAKQDLEACRRALKRSNRDWRGERDPDLPSKTHLAASFLCLKATLDWKQGLDAEAMDGILVALEIAQITGRLEQDRTRAQQGYFELCGYDLMLTVESWAGEAARHILSGHRLSPAQLTEVERRLDALRATRLSPTTPLLINWEVRVRRSVLEPNFSVLMRDAAGVASRRNLRENLGLRDLYDERIRTSRVLGSIRRGALNAANLRWNESTALEPLWEACCLGYTEYEVDQLWSLSPGFEAVYRHLLRWDLLRVAVGVARYEAANNQMPLTLDNAGVGEILARPVTLKDNTFIASPYPPGMTASPDPVDPNNWTWTIHRR